MNDLTATRSFWMTEQERKSRDVSRSFLSSKKGPNLIFFIKADTIENAEELLHMQLRRFFMFSVKAMQ